MASCMAAGARLVANGPEGLEISGTYAHHGSVVYGAARAAGGLLASCSFYDRAVHAWRDETPEETKGKAEAKKGKKLSKKQRAPNPPPPRLCVAGTGHRAAPAAFDGAYALHDEHNGQPRWRHETASFFVYFDARDNCWAVGNQVDPTRVVSSDTNRFGHPLGLSWVPHGVTVT